MSGSTEDNTDYTGDNSSGEDDGYRPIPRRKKRHKRAVVIYGDTVDKNSKSP